MPADNNKFVDTCFVQGFYWQMMEGVVPGMNEMGDVAAMIRRGVGRVMFVGYMYYSVEFEPSGWLGKLTEESEWGPSSFLVQGMTGLDDEGDQIRLIKEYRNHVDSGPIQYELTKKNGIWVGKWKNNQSRGSTKWLITPVDKNIFNPPLIGE